MVAVVAVVAVAAVGLPRIAATGTTGLLDVRRPSLAQHQNHRRVRIGIFALSKAQDCPLNFGKWQMRCALCRPAVKQISKHSGVRRIRGRKVRKAVLTRASRC